MPTATTAIRMAPYAHLQPFAVLVNEDQPTLCWVVGHLYVSLVKVEVCARAVASSVVGVGHTNAITSSEATSVTLRRSLILLRRSLILLLALRNIARCSLTISTHSAGQPNTTMAAGTVMTVSAPDTSSAPSASITIYTARVVAHNATSEATSILLRWSLVLLRRSLVLLLLMRMLLLMMMMVMVTSASEATPVMRRRRWSLSDHLMAIL